ncbi:MAG: glycosyltransferase family 4 protein [Sphingomonadaceae bacterium]|nr:glycosyltransferase family 4 protein [Sphingomonadaceae bacterium]
MSGTRRLLMTVDAVGGVWQYATELATALAPRGWETVLALLGPAATPAQRGAVSAIVGARLIETGLPLDWLADDAAAVSQTAEAVAALAADKQVDLIHLNQPALAATARFPTPIVAVAHSCVGTWWEAVHPGEPEPEAFGWQTDLMRRGLQRADAAICPSASFAEAVQRRYALARPPHVVANGRSPLAGPAGALHDFAFTAGRLWDAGKNVATLDRAAARLGVPIKAAGPLAGPNGERVAVSHLHALGSVDTRRLAGCLAARPVFVSAAKYEPFGLAVLEAALAGCPLVLSDIPTFRELWGGAALFVPADDADGFADAIEHVLRDGRERLTRGDLARRAAQRFTPAQMAAGMAAIYRPLLAPQAKAAA